MLAQKRCSSCMAERPLSEFHRCKSNKDGLQHRCKPCQNSANDRSLAKKSTDERRRYAREKMAAWRVKNPERNRETRRASRARNPEKHRSRYRDWLSRNRDKAHEASSRWKVSNPEKVAAGRARWIAENLARHREAAMRRLRRWITENPEKARELRARMAAKRRAVERRATPAWYDQFVVGEIYATAAERSRLTGVEHHVDHIVPLRSKYVCGLHWHGNMRVITKHENSSKRNTVWPDMPLTEVA